MSTRFVEACGYSAKAHGAMWRRRSFAWKLSRGAGDRPCYHGAQFFLDEEVDEFELQ